MDRRDVAEGVAQGTPTQTRRGNALPNVRLIKSSRARSMAIRPVGKPIIFTLRQSRFGACRYTVLAAKWNWVSRSARPRKHNNHDFSEV